MSTRSVWGSGKCWKLLPLGLVLASIGCGSGQLEEQDFSDAPADQEQLDLELDASVFRAIADAEVREGDPRSNFGARAVFQSDGSPDRWSFLKFDVRGLSGKVTRARIRCLVANASNDGPALYATSNGWAEGSINWNNRPQRIGSAIDDLGVATGGSWVEFDVTQAIQGNGVYSFVLTPTSTDAMACRSRESSSVPRLVVSYEQPKYDLIVTDIRWTPANPQIGDEVRFSVTIQNVGNAPTPTDTLHAVQFLVDGSNTPATWANKHTAGGLAPGAKLELESNGPLWIPTNASHSVVAFVDRNDVIPAEANESNNTRQETVEVTTDASPPPPPPPPATGCNRDLALPGDSNPCTVFSLPVDAFRTPTRQLGRVINVEDFGAVGSDGKDDTAAFIAAYDYVMNAMESVGWDGFFQRSNKASFIIYVPDGVYGISRSIIYSGAARYVPRTDGTPIKTAEAVAQLRFIGQSRERTILELASGTFDSTPGAVLSFGKEDFNNVPAYNAVRNLTIRTKPDNRMATGIYFGGANAADIENVRIVSEDGEGNIGIDNSIGTVVGPQRNITIEGFDYGFRMFPYHFTHPVLEHVTVRGQRVAGVHLVNGTSAIRALLSENAVPAVVLSDAGAHAVLIDSALEGGATNSDAVRVLGGAHLFARDTSVTGYGCTMRKNTACLFSGNIDEYVSDAPIRRSSTRPAVARSLALEIQEPPQSTWASIDPSQWVKPNYSLADANNGVDASARIQAAVDSGLPVLYLPAHQYVVNDTIEIPCSLKRVEGLFTDVVGSASPKFRVSGNCAEPVLLKDINVVGGVAVRQSSLRPLVLYHFTTRAFLYENDVPVSAGTPTLFGYMVGNLKAAKPFRNVKAFLRMGSGESHEGTYLVEGATTQVWVLGFKTEKAQASFRVQSGATLEVLGGILNQYSQAPVSSWEDPAAIAVQIDGAASRLSFVAVTNGPSATATGDGFRTLIRDASLSTMRTWRWDDTQIPKREGRSHQEVIPLYVSY